SSGEGGTSVMETSNFAHVIFQNVGKSFLPQAALECHYTLTPFITPHPKDWVGIFKVGWSSARDYYTFLWSPMPEDYTEGSTVHRVLVFQGYYVPRSDGEFYQFCYVTHLGEIRGASTPFQFQQATPTGEELLTVEDDSNSDILVVTTKTGLLERRVEEVQQECRELQKSVCLLTQERDQLKEEQRQYNQRERERERERETFLFPFIEDLMSERQRGLREERDKAQAGVRQLEQDLLGVAQKAVLKESELDCLRNRLQKVTMERDNLEVQLKNESDERELYKVSTACIPGDHLVTVMRECHEIQIKRKKTDREAVTKPVTTVYTVEGYSIWCRKQLRQVKEQLEATYQRAAMLDSELRDATRDHERTKVELLRVRQEVENTRSSLADAQEECRITQIQLNELMSQTLRKTETAGSVSELEAELQKEVEELKLRLQMAAEHYKEKYRECQRLRRQVTKLTHKQESQQEVCVHKCVQDMILPSLSVPGAPTLISVLPSHMCVSETLPEIQECAETQEREDGEGEKTETGKEEQQDEGDESSVSVEAELARMEERWREQCVINDNLKLLLAEEEQRFKAQYTHTEVFLLRENLAEVMREKVKLEEDLRLRASREDAVCGQRSEVREPVVLRYPLPYPTESPPLALVPQQPAELQYGNPYSEPEQRDGADGALSPQQSCRPPPVTPPPWVGPVVCSQPLRSLSPPDGLENPAEERPSVSKRFGGDGEAPAVCEHQSPESNESGSSFCFDTRSDVHKRCPLCEVIFPPHFEQRSFERHVESHWRECPVCSEQFPLDCQQNLFEKHVLTHFDGNVLNF
ncbi:tax1-binding protein 1-like A, partial [Silurus asotus]